MTRLVALCLLLSACRPPFGPWEVIGGTPEQQVQTQAMVQVAITLTPDRNYLLREGGVIVLHTDRRDALVGLCYVPAGYIPSGCSDTGVVDVLLWTPDRLGPDMRDTALGHELCHLGLTHGGGMFGGPVVGATETEADACGAVVNVNSPPLGGIQ